MQTECTPDIFGFEAVEGRQVVAAFDGGAITSDAGALLLGATDRAIRMVDRLASCFVDRRSQAQVEHSVATLVGQRIFAIALGYEDLNDHETLRHDPLMAVLAGKLEARRTGRRRARSPSISMPPTIRCTVSRRAASSMATTNPIVTCRCIFFAGGTCFAPGCVGPTSTPARARSKRWRGSLRGSASVGPGSGFCCGRIRGSHATT